MTQDIFNDANKVKGNWFQKTAIGDKISGTFIGKRSQMNSLSGKDQLIYELITPEGEIWSVGGNAGIDQQMRYVKLGQIIGFEYTEDRPSKVAGHNPTKVVQVYADPKVVNQEWLAEQETEAMNQKAIDQNNGVIDLSEQVEEIDVQFDKSATIIKNTAVGPTVTTPPVTPVVNTTPTQPIAPAQPVTIPATPSSSVNIQSSPAQPVGTTAPTPQDIATTNKEQTIVNLAQSKLGVTDVGEVQKMVMKTTGLAYMEGNYDAIIQKLQSL